jgi:hypothetical protein
LGLLDAKAIERFGFRWNDLTNTAYYSKFFADQGHPSGQCYDRRCRLKGKDISIDLRNIRDYFQLSADQEHCSAIQIPKSIIKQET